MAQQLFTEAVVRVPLAVHPELGHLVDHGIFVLAGELATGLFVGRTFQFVADREKKIECLSPADVSKAFGKMLDPNKLVIVQAGDFAKAAKGKEPPAKSPTKGPKQ